MVENDKTAPNEAVIVKRRLGFQPIVNRIKDYCKNRFEMDGFKQSKWIYILLLLVIVMVIYGTRQTIDATSSTKIAIKDAVVSFKTNDSINKSNISSISSELQDYKSSQDSTNADFNSKFNSAIKRADENSRAIRRANDMISDLRKRQSTLESKVAFQDTALHRVISAVDQVTGGETFPANSISYNSQKPDTLHKTAIHNKKKLKVSKKISK